MIYNFSFGCQSSIMEDETKKGKPPTSSSVTHAKKSFYSKTWEINYSWDKL